MVGRYLFSMKFTRYLARIDFPVPESPQISTDASKNSTEKHLNIVTGGSKLIEFTNL